MLCLFALRTGAAAQVQEVEPNELKATATLAVLDAAAGGVAAQIQGLTTGSSSTAGSDSRDVWRIRTAAAAPGIYRYSLALTSTTTGQQVSLRGLTQVGGVVTSGSDATAQSPAAGTAATWYGFGKAEEMYCRVSGTSATTGDYFGTLTRSSVAPVVVSGSVPQGPVTVRVLNASGFPDVEVWLYDANFNAVETNVPSGAGPGGADDNLIGDAALCGFTRTLVPGTYYAAVGEYNLANNQSSAAGDFGSAAVLDFSNSVVSSAVGRTLAAGVTLSVTGATGSAVTSPLLTFPVGGVGVVHFVQFTVAAGVGPAVSSCTWTPTGVQAGAIAQVSAQAVPGSSGSAITSVSADLSGLGLGTLSMSPSTGAAYSASVVVPTGQALGLYPVTITATDAAGQIATCSATLRVVAPGDECAGAMALTTAATASGSTLGATASVTGPLCSGATLDQFFVFVPGQSGAYVFTLTPSAGSASLSVSPTCDNFSGSLFCDISRATPTVTGAINLSGGSPVYVRVASFQGDAGSFTLSVQSSPIGACCSGVDGTCVMTAQAACTSGQFVAGVGACTPDPCPAFGACCDGVTFACTLRFSAACGAPSVFLGDASVCVPSSCPARPNDECAGATTINAIGTLAHNTISATTGTAAPTCGAIASDAWYRWTAPANGSLRIWTQGPSERLAVYAAGADAATCFASPDLSCAGAAAFASAAVMGGQSYLVQAGSLPGFVPSLSGLSIWFVPASTGACCIENSCVITPASACAGTFTPGGACVPDTTTVTSYTGLNAAVTDYSSAAGVTFVSRSLTVADSFTVADVEVDITGTHTWMGDLVISLEKDGRVVELVNRARRDGTNALGSGANLSASVLTFADRGTQSLHAALPSTAPTTVPAGVYKAASAGGMVTSLRDAFNGVSATGVWMLRVSDWAQGDAGEVQWVLRLKRGGSATCVPVSAGRCCVGARCVVGVVVAQCVAGGGAAGTLFVPSVNDCNASNNFIQPCCIADYNKAGGVSVQDVFDFLTDYFGGLPNANVLGNGTDPPTVQDVFDFLTAFFVGC